MLRVATALSIKSCYRPGNRGSRQLSAPVQKPVASETLAVLHRAIISEPATASTTPTTSASPTPVTPQQQNQPPPPNKHRSGGKRSKIAKVKSASKIRRPKHPRHARSHPSSIVHQLSASEPLACREAAAWEPYKVGAQEPHMVAAQACNMVA